MLQIDAVVITGAGRGIGKSIALELSKIGSHILCISKSSNALKTAKEIKKHGGSAEALVIDIADYEATEKKLFDWTAKNKYKKLGVVLAAGILGPRGPFSTSTLKKWDECIKVNVFGNLAVLQGILPGMLENQFGRIVTFAGGGSAYQFPAFPAYSASKTAIVRISENIYEDLKDKGDFSIVCLAPGAVETDMLKEVRLSGAQIKTTVDILEPVNFVKEFIISKSCSLSGRFVHVRDSWKDYLKSDKVLQNDSLWKLRRIE